MMTDQNRGQMSSGVLKASDGQRNFIKREKSDTHTLLLLCRQARRALVLLYCNYGMHLDCHPQEQEQGRMKGGDLVNKCGTEGSART
jgi:hypothetical protein